MLDCDHSCHVMHHGPNRMANLLQSCHWYSVPSCMVTYSTDFGAFAAIGRLHIKYKMDKHGRNYPHMHICEFVDSMSMDMQP